MEKEYEIKFIHNENYVSFIHKPTYAVAELTRMNTHILHKTTNDLINSNCKIINKIEDNNEQWLFFNRLYHKDYLLIKGLNIGQKLLSPLCNFVDDYKINIFCYVNPYRGMDKYRLIKLYKKFNFINIFNCEEYDCGLIRYFKK
jgi:hypothetical protein